MKLRVVKVEDVEEIPFNKAFNQFLVDVQNRDEKIFETALRTVAQPPIKGEITKGKIQWRGIRLCTQMDGLTSYKWIEQRGKQISPKIYLEIFNHER